MDIATLMADVNDFVWGPIMLAFLVGKIGRAHV